jgi:hypothetical protein
MDVVIMREFFGWATLWGAVFTLFTVGMVALAGDAIHRLHGSWFPLSRETFTLVVYGFISLLKLGVILFALVPYLALVMMG